MKRSDGKGAVRLLDPQDSTAILCVGQPGVGKSKFLESLFIGLAWLTEVGGCLIDPHGDLFRNMVYHLAALLPQIPGLAERVVIVDPTHPKWTVPINPLAATDKIPSPRVAASLTDMCVKLWGIDGVQAPRMMRLTNYTFQALADLQLTLLDAPRFLMDSAWRNSLLPGLADESTRGYFAWEFPKGEGTQREWVTPLLNRLGRLIQDPDLQLMFSGTSRLDTLGNMDNGRLVLVNGSKGLLGESTVAMLLAFIVADHQKAALSRAASRVRRPYLLFLDEFQNYTTDNITTIIDESRKYQLKLVLAHQYLKQLDTSILNSVLNASGTLITFRVGYQDASHLAKEVFPSPDFMTKTERHFGLDRRSLFKVSQKDVPLGWEGLALLLSNLQPREYVLRRRGPYLPVKQRTRDLPDPKPTPQLDALVEELYDASGERYGIRKSQLRAQFQAVGGERPFDEEAWPETLGWDTAPALELVQNLGFNGRTR